MWPVAWVWQPSNLLSDHWPLKTPITHVLWWLSARRCPITSRQVETRRLLLPGELSTVHSRSYTCAALKIATGLKVHTYLIYHLDNLTHNRLGHVCTYLWILFTLLHPAQSQFVVLLPPTRPRRELLCCLRNTELPENPHCNRT